MRRVGADYYSAEWWHSIAMLEAYVDNNSRSLQTISFDFLGYAQNLFVALILFTIIINENCLYRFPNS